MSKFKITWIIILILTAAIVVPPCSFFAAILIMKSPRYVNCKGTANTYAEFKAEKKMDFISKFIPTQAENLNYSVFPYRQSAEVVFDIDKNSFLAWAKKMKWDLKESDKMALEEFIRPFKFRKDYFFEKIIAVGRPTEDIKVVYDKSQKKCFIYYGRE